MEEVKGFTSMGSGAWKTFNTLLGAADTAMGATALGSKTSEDKVREIIREENGMKNCSENTPVSRFEMEQSQRIALLEANGVIDNKILDAYKQSVADNKALQARIDELAAKNSAAHETIYKELVAQREAQLTSNAKFDKDIALNAQAAFYQQQLNDCKYYTCKKVVDKASVCPSVMPEYNSWTAPTSNSN